MALWNVGPGQTYSTISAALAAIVVKYPASAPFTETEEVVVYENGSTYNEYVSQLGINPTATYRLLIHGATNQRPYWYCTDAAKVGNIWIRNRYTSIYNFRLNSGGYIAIFYGEVATMDLKLFNNIIYTKTLNGSTGANIWIYNNIFSRAASGASGGAGSVVANNTFIDCQNSVSGYGATASDVIIRNNLMTGDISTGYASVFLTAHNEFYNSDYNSWITGLSNFGYAYKCIGILFNAAGIRLMFIKSNNDLTFTYTVADGTSSGKKFTLVQGATTEVYDNQADVATAVALINAGSAICTSGLLLEGTLVNVSFSPNSGGSYVPLSTWLNNGTFQETHTLTIASTAAMKLVNYSKPVANAPNVNLLYAPAQGSPNLYAGADMSAYFTTDMNGNARTVPWTIGAMNLYLRATIARARVEA